jgi:hypothetical protein
LCDSPDVHSISDDGRLLLRERNINTVLGILFSGTDRDISIYSVTSNIVIDPVSQNPYDLAQSNKAFDNSPFLDGPKFAKILQSFTTSRNSSLPFNFARSGAVIT